MKESWTDKLINQYFRKNVNQKNEEVTEDLNHSYKYSTRLTRTENCSSSQCKKNMSTECKNRLKYKVNEHK